MSNHRKKSPLKLLSTLFFVILGAAAYFYYYYGDAPQEETTADMKHVVAVSQIIDFPVLNQVRQGVKDGLKLEGYEIGKNIQWIYENAQGNMAVNAQIAKKFVSINPDVIVAIATPSAQAVLATRTKIPLVFAAVTDPISTKLVKNLEHPGGNTTGSTDNPPVEKNIQLIRKILPQAQTIGVLYNSAEPNSTALVEIIQGFAKKYGLKVELAVVPKTSEALSATKQLVESVDAILFPLDNTVTAVAKSIVKLATSHKVPVFSLDPAVVGEGALASYGVSEYQGGVEAGRIVGRILNGENPGDIPIRNPEGVELKLNPEKAKELGIKFPEGL